VWGRDESVFGDWSISLSHVLVDLKRLLFDCTSYRAFLRRLQKCPVGYLICLRLCVLQATSHRTSVSLRGPLPPPTERGPLPRGPPTRRGPLAAGAGRASPAAPRGTSAAAAVEGAAATRVGWRRWRWRGGRERVEIGSSDGAATGVGLPEMGPRETLRHHFDSSGTLTGPWKGGRAAG
jgi:hypothetical protein